MKKLLAPSILLCCAGAAAGQTGLLDQWSPWTPGIGWFLVTFDHNDPTLVWQQQVRAGVAGQLEGVRLLLNGPAGAQVTVRVREGAAWSAGPVLFTTVVTKQSPDDELVFVDTMSGNIGTTIGQPFVIETQGNGTGLWIGGNFVQPSVGPPVYPEPLMLAGFEQNGARFSFETYVVPPGGCYANCDASTSAPVLNVADFTCFLQRFAAGDLYANCDESTTFPQLNVADFTCFLQRFAAGCP